MPYETRCLETKRRKQKLFHHSLNFSKSFFPKSNTLSTILSLLLLIPYRFCTLTYEVSTDGLQFDILSTQVADANLLLGANNIPTAAYTLDDVLDGSFSTTEADKQKR